MKKICFITTISTTLKAFVLETAKYLHENGNYDITLICDTDEDFGDSLPKYIHFIPVPMKRGINIHGIKAIFKLLLIFKKEEFDLIQYSTPNASLYASVAGKLSRVPVRLYCQWGIVYVGFSGFKRKLFKLVERLVCSLSTWVEPDSFGNLKFSHKEGLYTDRKSSVIWNGSACGVDLTKFDITHKNKWRQEVRSNFSISHDTFVVGFVGRITKDKGINELFSACKRFFEMHTKSVLILVGSPEKTETIDGELVNWSLNDKRVICCGISKEVQKFLAAMDVFVLPSYREGFGSVVIEAEAMGIPVIVTDIPGPTDAMVGGKTGLIVKKGDADSLFYAIEALKKNTLLRDSMGKRGYEFVRNNFDRYKLVQYILDDRDRLLNVEKLECGEQI